MEEIQTLSFEIIKATEEGTESWLEARRVTELNQWASDALELLNKDVFTGFREILEPIDQNSSSEEIKKRQEEVRAFYERVLEFARKDGVKTLAEISSRYKQQVLKLANSQATAGGFLGNNFLSFTRQQGLFNRTVQSDRGALTPEETRDLKELVKIAFGNPTGIQDLHNEAVQEYIQKHNPSERVKKQLGTFVQSYFDNIAAQIDQNKLQKIGEAVQLLMMYEGREEEDGKILIDLNTPREQIAHFGFGDVASGKGTANKNLGIDLYVFITGTGGMSKPGLGYEQFALTTSGIMPAIDAGGFNPLMTLLAPLAIGAARSHMDKSDAGNLPMFFDGYPRDAKQMNQIMNKLIHFNTKRKSDANNPLSAYYLTVEEGEALKRTLSRIVDGLRIGDVRNDDLNEVKIEGDNNLVSMLNEFIKDTENSNLNTRSMVEKFIEQNAERIGMNPNGRYKKYQDPGKGFPAMIRSLENKGLTTTVIHVENLTPIEQAFAIFQAVGPSAFPRNEQTVQYMRVLREMNLNYTNRLHFLTGISRYIRRPPLDVKEWTKGNRILIEVLDPNTRKPKAIHGIVLSSENDTIKILNLHTDEEEEYPVKNITSSHELKNGEGLLINHGKIRKAIQPSAYTES